MSFLANCRWPGSCGGYGAIPPAHVAAGDGRQIILPQANREEIVLLPGSQAYLADCLQQVCRFLQGNGSLIIAEPTADTLLAPSDDSDLAEVIGQQQARHALEVATDSGHNLLLIRPLGTGKTMLASQLPGLPPPLTDNEAIETAAITLLVWSESAPPDAIGGSVLFVPPPSQHDDGRIGRRRHLLEPRGDLAGP